MFACLGMLFTHRHGHIYLCMFISAALARQKQAAESDAAHQQQLVVLRKQNEALSSHETELEATVAKLRQQQVDLEQVGVHLLSSSVFQQTECQSPC